MSDHNKIEKEFKMNSKRTNLKQIINEFKTNLKRIKVQKNMGKTLRRNSVAQKHN